MTSFADIDWRHWQRAEPEEFDAASLQVIVQSLLAGSDATVMHGAIRELERRVAALEAKQPREEEAPIGIPFTWSNVDALSVGCDYNLNN